MKIRYWHSFFYYYMFLPEAVSRGVKVGAGNPPVKIRGSLGFRGVRGTPLSYLFSFFYNNKYFSI
jgi:hypothetical protein